MFVCLCVNCSVTFLKGLFPFPCPWLNGILKAIKENSNPTKRSNGKNGFDGCPSFPACDLPGWLGGVSIKAIEASGLATL